MWKDNIVRKLIQVILEQGMKVGIDVAGGFLGPAWPFVKPVIEKLVDGLPKNIANRYKSSQDAINAATAALEKDEAQIALVQAALEKHGITPEWVASLLTQLDSLSDDVFTILQEQGRQQATLTEILQLAEKMAKRQPARLVFRGERLEYVDYLQVEDDYLPGYDLAPGTHIDAGFAGRHLPAGFLIWNFMLLNDGQQLATVTGMEMVVKAELPYPESSELGGVLPMIEPFEDEIQLLPGATHYPLFKGKYFKYAPEADVDAFRIRAIFQSDQRLLQQLQLVIHWQDGTGPHTTYGSPLFLAAMEQPQLEVSHSKFGFGH
jgi:hypothetical protein